MKTGSLLITDRQRIRHWEDTDADRRFFHRMNSEDEILKYFPFRRSRAEADEVFDRLRAQAESNGFGWALAEDRASGKPIGFTGLSKIRDEDEKTICPGVEIGWRYVPEAWGKRLASESARALLVYGFDEIGLDHISAFAVADNQSSIAVMQRIGMTARPDLDFDHPGVPDEMPHLKRHVIYQMRATDPRG